MQRIEAEHLTFSYNGKKDVISDVSFSIQEGETVGLIGANGVGKSTILKLSAGLLTGYKGLLRVSGQVVEKKNLTAIREKMGYVFQDSDSQLFMPTVFEDVSFAPRNYGYPMEEVIKRTQKALETVHIEHLSSSQIYRLSGGEKKLASIATILSMEPEVILLDEPSVALDPRNRKNLIRVIKELPGLKIIASHDLDLIMDTCERTILLSDSKIVKDGKTTDILYDKQILEMNGLELPLSLSR